MSIKRRIISARRSLQFAMVSIVLTGALASCTDPAAKPLRIGLDPWPGFAVLFIAREKNYFLEEGVVVELVELTSLSDVRRTFERGLIDGMASSLVEVLEVVRHASRPLSISLMTDYSNGADVVLASNPITSMRSLEGKRIAAEPGTLNHFLLARALEMNGLGAGSVEILSYPQNAMFDALAENDVDAVVSYPPVSSQIRRSAEVHDVFNSAQIPGEIADVISFDVEIMTQRRAEIEAFKRAWARAVAFLKGNPKEALELLSQHTGMTVPELQAAYEDIQLVDGASQDLYLIPGGPLQKSVDKLQMILWPDDVELSELDFGSLFMSDEKARAWTTAWN